MSPYVQPVETKSDREAESKEEWCIKDKKDR